MTDEVLNQNISKVISVSQDYILMGKSSKETELKIYIHGDDYEASKKKVENVIRLSAYAEGLVSGQVAIPKYVPENPIKMHVEESDAKTNPAKVP